ncbi:MAG: hypothetical protein HYR63_15875 [Proteobacteria bacterium]|nr:hypothetical protein [Pseudomonadota bacterium]MBI3499692.1 hypothetical protein [Pseudomonadota bacterium]
MATAIPLTGLLPASRRLALICLALVSITVLAAGVAVWDLHDREIANYRRDMTNIGVLLTEQTSRFMQAVDLVVTETCEKVSASRIRDPEEFKRLLATEEIHHFLQGQLKSLPQADAIAITGADGKLINFSRGWPIPDIDVTDRDYYRHFLTRDDPGAFISAPVTNRATSTWTFYLARRINNPQGVFLGSVQAAIEVAYLENSYKAITLHEGGSVSLLRRDGMILVRYPAIESLIGTRMPTESPWYAQVAQNGGSYRSPGYLDGMTRVVSVHPLKEYPLVVGVTITEEEALGHWRVQSVYIALGAFGIVVGFIVLFWLLAIQFRRLEDQASELARGGEALRHSEGRFRDYTKTASDWYWETGPDRRFTLQPEGIRKLGIDPKDWVGKLCSDVAADVDKDPEKWRQHFTSIDRHESFRDFVYQIALADGSIRTIASSGNPVIDEKGVFQGYRGTGRDVTQQIDAAATMRRAKEEAEAANRTKSQFLANMSHELRTPLNAVIAFSEVIRDKAVDANDLRFRDYAADIHVAGRHLLNLINDILDVSRIEVGRLELREEIVDIAETIERCLRLVRQRAQDAGLTLEEAISPALPSVRGDRRRLKQIILNLLSNAIKFTQAGGRVSIAAAVAQDGGLVVSITDTGIGIKAEDIPTALTPFRQVDGGLNRNHDGAGLGLPLAKTLAELHEGRLEIASRVGHGTTVRLWLPPKRVAPSASLRVREPAAAKSE